MIQVQCSTCQQTFWVEGYTTPSAWDDTGEVVTELESKDPICQCLQDGAEFAVIDEEHETFDDDCI